MAKDPAFLFYSKDFYEGTRMMLPEERACYIDLLMYQHQNEFIPNDIKRLAMYCSGISQEIVEATLKAKFKLCDKGWFNDKLLKVCIERKEFSNKQSVNGAIGQFWKKSKAILTQKEYESLKQLLYNQPNTSILELIKDKDINKAMLEAMLKHLASVNVNGITDVNKNIDLDDSKEKSDFYNFRLNQLETLNRETYEKLKNDYGITEPIVYTHRTQHPITEYDLVEHLAFAIESDEWKQSLITRFGKNKKFSKAMVDYFNLLKTNYEYLDFKSTYDFRKYFANWFNTKKENY